MARKPAAKLPSPVSGGGAGGEGAVFASLPPTLTITSSINGFRRAGRAWSSEPTTVSAAEFTPEQLAQLRAEPRLTISSPLPQAGEG
jgi:hypothetical protein